MGHEPSHDEAADGVPDVMAMEVDPSESYVKDPNGQGDLSSWDLLEDEWLNKQDVDCEDASLSCVPTGPGAVDLISPDIENSLREIFRHWPGSLEVFLEHHTCDKCRQAHCQVLRPVVNEVVRLHGCLKVRKDERGYKL